MTTLSQLSQLVADKYGVPAYVKQIVGFDIKEGNIYEYTHIYQDTLRLFELCIEHDIYYEFDSFYNHDGMRFAGVYAIHDDIASDELPFEDYTDHPSKKDAVNACMLKALAKLAGIDIEGVQL